MWCIFHRNWKFYIFKYNSVTSLFPQWNLTLTLITFNDSWSLNRRVLGYHFCLTVESTSMVNEGLVEGYLIVPPNSLDVNLNRYQNRNLYSLWLKSPDVLVLPFTCFLCADKPLFLDGLFLTRMNVGLSDCLALLVTAVHNSELRNTKATKVLLYLKTPNKRHDTFCFSSCINAYLWFSSKSALHM